MTPFGHRSLQRSSTANFVVFSISYISGGLDNFNVLATQDYSIAEVQTSEQSKFDEEVGIVLLLPLGLIRKGEG